MIAKALMIVNALILIFWKTYPNSGKKFQKLKGQKLTLNDVSLFLNKK